MFIKFDIMSPERMELQDKNGDLCFYCEYNKKEEWIYNCWIGTISDNIVKKGGGINLELIEKFGCKYILNDNRLLIGNWSDSNDWIENEYIPNAISLGLRYIAHVFSPKFITKFSAVDLSSRDLPLTFKTFDNISSAQSWLREMRESDSEF